MFEKLCITWIELSIANILLVGGGLSFAHINENILFPIFTPILIGLGLILDVDVLRRYDKRLRKYDKELRFTIKMLNDAQMNLHNTIIDVSKAKGELQKTKKEIEEMKDQTFDAFSKRGFKNIEQRLKEVEEEIGINGSILSSIRYNKSLKEIIKELKDDIDKIKKKLDISTW